MTQSMLRKIILLVLILAVMTFFTIMSPYFFTANNLFTLLQEASFLGIAAVGVTFVMIAGGLDLSIGSATALTAMVCINFLEYTNLPVLLFLPISLLAGAFVGTFNGFVINRFKLPDFIVTLSSKGVFSGLALVIAVKENGFVSNVFIDNPTYLWFAGKLGPLYYVTIAFVIIAIGGHFLLKWTKFGTYVYAVGANKNAAMLSGVDIKQIKYGVYILAGVAASITAIFQSSRMMTAMPEMGIGTELDIIAAIVIGGTAFRGGRGDIIGTVMGVLFLTIVKNGIFKLQITPAIQQIVIGGIIIAAVVFDEWYRNYSARKRNMVV
ncbi:MAG: ABC transporter permease [Spirochaetia bacterium]|nr:ABC transporter permease [Spirochaetia bacterium]